MYRRHRDQGDSGLLSSNRGRGCNYFERELGSTDLRINVPNHNHVHLGVAKEVLDSILRLTKWLDFERKKDQEEQEFLH